VQVDSLPVAIDSQWLWRIQYALRICAVVIVRLEDRLTLFE
jgi:hypothetical protein